MSNKYSKRRRQHRTPPICKSPPPPPHPIPFLPWPPDAVCLRGTATRKIPPFDRFEYWITATRGPGTDWYWGSNPIWGWQLITDIHLPAVGLAGTVQISLADPPGPGGGAHGPTDPIPDADSWTVAVYLADFAWLDWHFTAATLSRGACSTS